MTDYLDAAKHIIESGGHPLLPARTLGEHAAVAMTLATKPPDTLTEAEANELLVYELARQEAEKGADACNCNAGAGPHRSGCPALGGRAAISSRDFYGW